MVVRIQVDTREAIRGLEGLEQGIQEAIQTTLDKSAQSAVDGAQSIVPVRTGRLRDSIGVKEQGSNHVVVAADTPYTAAVEFGVGAREAKPYLGPQSDRLQSEAPKILSDELGKRNKK